MGGAKNCPETPRQRMIAMMYLVLTAMLALNVSTDILNGFALVDDNLHSSLEATEIRNKAIMDDFAELNASMPAKYGEAYAQAEVLIAKSDSLYDYIQDFKKNIITMADGKVSDGDTAAVRKIQGKDNLDVAANYAINQKNGEVLKAKIKEYRDFLIQCANNDSTKRASFEQIFSTADGRTKDGDPIKWESSIFEGMPVSASVTILTKIQNDIRSSEGEMLSYLKGKPEATDFNVNKLQALVIPESKYVMRGGKYSAQIVLSAVDSIQKPTYYVNGNKLADGLYEFTATGTGTHTYNGELVIATKDNGEIKIPFSSSYTVGEPSATISNTDLNIMYRNYDNKFSVSVPGVAAENIKVDVKNATATKKNNFWIIKPTKGSEVTVSVSANMDGRWLPMGSQTYRVKALPKPGVYLKSGSQEYNEGQIPRNAILNSPQIIASYGPDGLLDLKYTITSFTLDTPYGVEKSTSNAFTSKQMDILKKLKKGNILTITDVKAKDINGNTVSLQGIFLKMN